MQERPHLSVPYNSAASQSFIVVSMQMDAEFKKEQIGTLFVWVGALGGGLGGWVVSQGGSSPKSMPAFLQKFIYSLLSGLEN